METLNKRAPRIDTLAGYEIVDVLIERGQNSNAFEFISRKQMLKLIELFNEETQEPLIVSIELV